MIVLMLLAAVLTQDAAKKEVEPNDGPEQAQEIREGETWQGANSKAEGDEDWYVFKAAAAGPRELVVKRSKDLRGDLRVTAVDPGRTSYLYHLSEVVEEFHFYPVLEAGTWHVQLSIPGGTPLQAGYRMSLKPFGGKVVAEERKAAEGAIDRAVAYLLKFPEDRAEDATTTAAEGMALAALSEGRGARERRDTLDRVFVPALEKRFQKVEGGDLFSIDGNIYTHAMALLGLAEAVANGSEKAREPALRAAKFLIVTQNTERKPAAWKGPVPRTELGYGGWRYQPEDPSSDLSALGWCLVALTAVDAAGLKVEGLRDAVEAALQYVLRVGDSEGFGYQQPGGASNIHNSIGALLQLLYGEESGGFAFAARDLDAHLWSGTQVDQGEGYPFYYLYGAARAQYLRSGEAWETWRAAALRQLLRLQKADGSWGAMENEQQPGPRWTTAIGLMVLRLCLNDAPKYLRVEAKGF